MPSSLRWRLGLSMAATFLIFAPASARAMDAEVTSDTAAQFYDVRSPSGETTLSRRRLTTTLGVRAHDLLTHPAGAALPVRARLRYDADYGASATEDPTQHDSFVPGFSRGPVDLMYAYVEGR